MNACGFCGCDRLVPLGQLGSIEYFRCRNCGMDVHEGFNKSDVDQLAKRARDESVAAAGRK